MKYNYFELYNTVSFKENTVHYKYIWCKTTLIWEPKMITRVRQQHKEIERLEGASNARGTAQILLYIRFGFEHDRINWFIQGSSLCSNIEEWGLYRWIKAKFLYGENVRVWCVVELSFNIRTPVSELKVHYSSHHVVKFVKSLSQNFANALLIFQMKQSL